MRHLKLILCFVIFSVCGCSGFGSRLRPYTQVHGNIAKVPFLVPRGTKSDWLTQGSMINHVKFIGKGSPVSEDVGQVIFEYMQEAEFKVEDFWPKNGVKVDVVVESGGVLVVVSGFDEACSLGRASWNVNRRGCPEYHPPEIERKFIHINCTGGVDDCVAFEISKMVSDSERISEYCKIVVEHNGRWPTEEEFEAALDVRWNRH